MNEIFRLVHKKNTQLRKKKKCQVGIRVIQSVFNTAQGGCRSRWQAGSLAPQQERKFSACMGDLSHTHGWIMAFIPPKNSYFPWIHPITCVLGAPALTPPLNHPLKTHQSQILSNFFFLFPLFGEEPSSQRAPCVSGELRHGGKAVSRALTCTG